MKRIIALVITIILLLSVATNDNIVFAKESEVNSMAAICNIDDYGTSFVDAYISNLNNYWNNYYYSRAYITCNGQTSAPIYPPTAGSSTAFNYSTPNMTRSGTYTSGTFTVYAYVVATNGSTYSAGSASFYIAPPAPVYPDAPSSLYVANASDTQLMFGWTNGLTRDGTFVSLDGGSYTQEYGPAYAGFSFLLPGTTHTFRVYHTYNGYSSAVKSIQGTTTGGSYPPSTPTGLSFGARVYGGIVLTYTTANADSVTIRARLSGSSTYIYDSGNEVEGGTITNLAGGSSYYMSVKADNSYGSSSYTSEILVTTAPSTVVATISTITQTSVTSSFSVAGSWSSVEAQVYIEGTSTVVSESTVYSGSTITVNGLTPGGNYRVSYRSFQGAIYSIYATVNYFSAAASGESDWVWTTDFTQGNPMSTYTVGGSARSIVLPATEWNNFTTKINAFRTHDGLSLYTFTQAEPEHIFPKTMIDEAITAITAMNPPIVCPLSTTTVTASLFNGLRDSLNSIP